jgi:hypothetical protein
VASTSSAGWRIWIGVEEFSRSRVREPEGWPERAFQLTARSASKVGAVFGLHVIAYKLIRLGNLLKPAMAAA